jgi:hypothetical protein
MITVLVTQAVKGDRECYRSLAIGSDMLLPTASRRNGNEVLWIRIV